MTTVTGFGGSTAPALGIPVAKASAQVFPTNVARNPQNGDIAIAQTKAGQNFVYLIAGTSGPNEYNIQTGVGPPAFGSLVAGDVYLVAGCVSSNGCTATTGTSGLISDPGNNQFGNSTSAAATANPIVPTSVAFDANGNLLIAGAVPGTGSAVQVVSKSGVAMYGIATPTAGNLYTIGVVALSGAPAVAINMGSVTAEADGMSVDRSGNLVVGNGPGATFVNETGVTQNLYNKTIPTHSAAVIAGSAFGTSHCTGTGAASAPANQLFASKAAPFVDASDNVYFADNGGGTGRGCAWVLPAQSGSLYGMSVTAGNVYKLAGSGGTASTSDGIPAVNANVAGTSGVTIDPAGNVILAVESGSGFGSTISLQMIAAATCVSSCAYGVSTTTAGDIYTIATGVTSPSAVAFTGPTSVLSDGTGNLYLTDGPTSGSSQNLDELTGGPAAAPVVTGISPSAGPTGGGTTVTIVSSLPNFTGATAVHFGLTAATNVTVVSPSEVTATSPAGTGTVDVTVTTPVGTSATSPADQFLYVPAPTVTSIIPTSGPAAGGTSVTIAGTNFTGSGSNDRGQLRRTTRPPSR